MKKIASARKATEISTPKMEEVAEREIPQRMIHCVICSSDTHADSPEQMCWVCRRLKISAWREIEQPMPAQE